MSKRIISAWLVVAVMAAGFAAPARAGVPELDNRHVVSELLAGRHNIPNLGLAVMKPNLDLLNYGAPAAKMGVPISPNLDLLAYGVSAPKKPNYAAKMFAHDGIDAMTRAWQSAVDAATQQGAVSKNEGTWSINDMVKALQSNLKEIATYNSTNAAIAAGANGTDIPTTTGLAPAGQTAPSFGDFASSLLCSNGAKLANCSGINPCKTKHCGPVSMCLVDQCGGCNARCIGYVEIGSGVNKLLGVVGMKPLLPGSTTAATPNLPLVDKLVTGVQDLTKSVLPKCEANTITDITSLGCKACPEGSIAAVGAKACTACGRGQYADLKTISCKACTPGTFSKSPTGSKFCTPCPVNTYMRLSGQGSCLPCPAGLGTKGMKGQTKCVVQV